MKIIADKNIPFLDRRIPEADLIMLPAKDITRDAVRDADAVITRTRTRCGKELLDGSKVRLVATATIGTDHIDTEWCSENGIIVRNAPGCNAPGVALFVWSSLLRAGFDPDKDTIGVVGYGNVGRIVAQWGRRLGARVLISDPPRQEAGYSDEDYLPLEELLQRCDALTLHTPLTLGGNHPTHHLLGEDSMKSMKRGMLLVNAARGEVIDTASVVKAIEDGTLSKAIIDTWEGEPNPDRRLLQLANVATCHIAGYSVEGKQRATRMALEAIHDVLGINVVTEGLAGHYTPPERFSSDIIVSAYDPRLMTEALKNHPESFESLRNSYPLHKELL